ncbi:YciI family protein [Isoptericola sp. 4D.3]|uniref:YciI family protein n=1 Tax=Isoptericola peretonis TaxID=2918523 RepID=A0ABT0IYQ7_9MICO|nr:YciI family protein [Isoptericola sp. 4D.3]
MTTYVVLLPGVEDAWENASAEQRAAVYARHQEFARVLAERGHRVTGGAELTHSRTSKQVTRDSAGRVVVTDGPYAETAEQLTGFYLVESDDLDDLLPVCALLSGDLGDGDAGTVEVRAVVDHGEGAA